MHLELTDLREGLVDPVEEADPLRAGVPPEGEERLHDLGVLEHHVVHVSEEEEWFQFSRKIVNRGLRFGWITVKSRLT